jgi:DNA-binding MarR family transcriptional regulator
LSFALSLLGQNESAVAAMVVRLIKLGFLDRRRRDEDGRASLLSLTQAGRRELEATKTPFEELDRMLDGALAPDELDALTALLTRVATAFAGEPK